MSFCKSSEAGNVIAIVPAAGIGSRMGSNIPKQYLPLANQTILACTLDRLLNNENISKVIVALHPCDQQFYSLSQSQHRKIATVVGGDNRADSVLAALNTVTENTWVLVHDAARPCLTDMDINKLLAVRDKQPQGAILAMPVRDTMKRANNAGCIENTVCREKLWHAMTPQMFQSNQLKNNLSEAIENDALNVTDEASAMELAGITPFLVIGRADNIKVTHPEDLPLAELFIAAQQAHSKN